MDKDVAIVGAGLTGLTLAQALRDADRSVVVIEKARGLGGRVSTRRLDPRPGAPKGLSFDHGVPFVDALSSSPTAFSSFIESAMTTRAGQPWGSGRVIGAPGMSSLVKPLAEGIDLRLGTEVTKIEHKDGVWAIYDRSARLICSAPQLALAMPAPQVLELVGSVAGLEQALAPVKMTAAWVLMLAFKTPVLQGTTTLKPMGEIARVVRNSAKPGRERLPDAWVVEASATFSRDILRLDPSEAAERLFAALQGVTGPLPEPMFKEAHRWRYAHTTKPLGRPFISVASGRLLIGGDWTLGDRLEHAYASGQAMASEIIGRDNAVTQAMPEPATSE